MSKNFPINTFYKLRSQKTFVNATLPITHPITDYLNAVRRMADTRSRHIVSVLIFGSAPIGGFSCSVSDVDLMIVLADDVTPELKYELTGELAELERKHGLSECPTGRLKYLYTLCDQKIGGLKSQTVCYRRDLLSGNPAAVFEVNVLAERLLISTHIFCFASIFTSARTLWGEDLLPRIPIPALSRNHLIKDLIMHLLRNALALVGYPLLPNGTKYAMAILKGCLHNCFFVYTARGASLEEKIHFFRTKLGESEVLEQLLSLRKRYRPSPGFIFSCFRMLVRLYAVTLRENTFPITDATYMMLPTLPDSKSKNVS